MKYKLGKFSKCYFIMLRLWIHFLCNNKTKFTFLGGNVLKSPRDVEVILYGEMTFEFDPLPFPIYCYFPIYTYMEMVSFVSNTSTY